MQVFQPFFSLFSSKPEPPKPEPPKPEPFKPQGKTYDENLNLAVKAAFRAEAEVIKKIVEKTCCNRNILFINYSGIANCRFKTTMFTDNSNMHRYFCPSDCILAFPSRLVSALY